MNINLIEQFKNREIKAKSIFFIKDIDKKVAYDFIKQYHYLKEAKFFSKFNFGLYIKESNELVGVASYSNPQGIVAMKSWFGLTNQDQSVLELGRLCMHPSLNGSNATSYLLGNSIKLLKKYGINAIITLADNSRHVGSIYQVCNFKYYGLTDAKTDFYTEDGKKNPRGATKEVKGVWIPRTRKHRYAFLLNNNLKVKYIEQPRPNVNDYENLDKCSACNRTKKVFDNRFNNTYECPTCVGYEKGLIKIKGENIND